jgi:uncharacterized protein
VWYDISMKPSQILAERRSDILAIVSKYHVRNLRVFGSVLRNEDSDKSDIDFLVEALPGISLFQLGGLQDELQTALGVHVDLLTELELHRSIRDKVIAEARPV